MKICNIDYIWCDHICFQIYGAVIAYFDDITNLEILPYLLHFSEVVKHVNDQIF